MSHMKHIDSILVAASVAATWFSSRGYHDSALFVTIGIIMLGLWRLYDALRAREARLKSSGDNLPCRYDANYSLCGGDHSGSGKSEKRDRGQ